MLGINKHIKMPTVNNKKVKVYDFDTVDTFKNRLARDMSTLPEYLYFSTPLLYEEIHSKKAKLHVDDVLAEIKENAQNSKTPVQDLSEIIAVAKKKMGVKSRDKIRDKIVSIWLLYNKNLAKKYKKEGKTSLDKLSKYLTDEKIYFTDTQFRRDYDSKDTTFSISDKLSSISKSVTRTLLLFDEYESIEEPSVFTDLRIEYVQFLVNLTTTTPVSSLLELFNAIILSNACPYSHCQSFYKILTDFIPPDEWTREEYTPDTLLLKVAHLREIYNGMSSTASQSVTSNYSNTVLSVDSLNDNAISADVTINIGKGVLTRDEFINRSISVFDTIGMQVSSIKEKQVVGTFYYVGLTLNRYVFSDLCLNDDLFSSLISIDDHEKATKKKAGIYIHFNSAKTGYVTATVTEKKYVKNDPTLKSEDQELFSMAGGSYIRVRVSRAESTKAIEAFQVILGKLFILYAQKYNDIVDIYREYIPDFGEVENLPVDDSHIDELPQDLFVTNYTRNCKADRMPKIVSADEADNIPASQVMKFPRDKNEGDSVAYPSDGQEQRYYTCTNPNYKFIGLKENKLKNSDKYPLVPCCFLVDQTTKPKYLQYYKGQETVHKDKRQDVIKTDKFLTSTQFGKLPSNIESLFTLISQSTTAEYVRKGVARNEHSFLNCVMEALDYETDILAVDKNKREAFLRSKRVELATKANVSLCRQEMYDVTPDKIIEMLKDPHIYLDPKLFIHLLEDVFGCNIFLFSKKNVEGDMILPRFSQAYYKNKNDSVCVYIFEHMGSESDHAKYPQCELIVKYNSVTGGEAQDNFTYAESKAIRNIYSRLRKAYALDKQITEKDISTLIFNEHIKIKAQVIDSYGKTRRIDIVYSGKNISIMTDPLQPIRATETTIEPHRVILKLANQLCEELGVAIDSQVVESNILTEVSGLLNNVRITILIDQETKSKPVKGVPISTVSSGYVGNSSSLTAYNLNKKLARYLTEYTLWMYSKYLTDNDIKNITDENINTFAEKGFIIDPNVLYANITKNFSLSSNMLKNGKIVIKNDETLKRLVYIVRLYSQRNIDAIFGYHTRQAISSYYVDITDFDHMNGQVILYGDESVSKWIDEHTLTYVVYETVQQHLNNPYFFKNNNVELGKIFLAQNSSSIEKAVMISQTWITDGYNPSTNTKDIANNIPTFTLYSYKDMNDVDKMIVKGDGSHTHDIIIVGYKIDNTPHYISLLDLG
jgi:hypothetical protein